MRMPLKFFLAVFLVAAFSPLSRTQAVSTVLDFEGFGDSTLLTSQILGANFTNAIVLTSGVSLNEFEFPPHSGINVISDNGGPISISFPSPVQFVSGYFTYNAAVTMKAFDAGNNPVAAATSLFANNEALSGLPGSAPNELISVAFAGGISTVTITGAPGGGSFALDDVTVKPPLVAAPPAPPPTPVSPPSPSQTLIITSSTLSTIPFGTTLTTTLTASGGNPPYTWSAPGAPAGFTLTGGGVLTATPIQPGANSFLVQVTDSVGRQAVTFLSLSVFGFTTSSLPDAVEYANYSQTLAATGGAPPYAFSGSGFPAGILINAQGIISGATKTLGAFKLLIQAVDSHGLVTSGVFSLKVNTPAPLTVPPATLSGIVGLPFPHNLAAAGGAPPYSWSLIAGSLPGGLSVNALGIISGAPAALGTFAIIARVTDSLGATATGTISFNIVPTLLSLTAPTALPSGMVNADYPIQLLSVSGGTPPYSFSSTGALPPGIGLSMTNGSISGTPTTAGNFPFMVTANDSAGTRSAMSLQIAVRPASADLLLSSGSLLFSAVAGSSAFPPAQVVQVQSGIVGTALAYSVAVTPPVPWLSVTQAAPVTPGGIAVSITSQAQPLSASGSPYQATLVVTCLAPSACAGKAQNLTVSLAVASPPARLSVLNNLLAFFTPAASPQPGTLNLRIQNIGGGEIDIASITSGAGWLSAVQYPIPLYARPPVAIAVTADPTGLSSGYYLTTLTIVTSAGTATVPVTLQIAQSPGMVLAPAGRQLSMAAGGAPPNAGNSFLVGVSGTSPVAWNAAVPPGSPWLTVSTPVGTSTNASPGTINFAIDPAAAAALSPGLHYGTIRVSSGSVLNSPLDFQLVLNVVSSTGAQTPALVPEGLLFISAGAAAPPAQIVQVFSNAPGAAAYQVAASTTDGHSWLSVSPSTGTATPAAPGQSAIAANPAGLASGIYYGSVTYAGTAAALRTVDVTLIVRNSAGAVSCRASQLALVPLDPANNFSSAAFLPVAIDMQLVDDCGNPVANGQVEVTFSNADPLLNLSLANASSGLYTGYWTPLGSSAQVTINAVASAPGLSSSTFRFSGTVTPGSAPVLTPNGTVHIFNARTGGAVAPGTIVQIFGSNFAGQPASASSIPLPTSLGGVSVAIGGIAAPLYYVSPGQITAEVPFELSPNEQVQVIVNANGALSTPGVVQLSAVSPGIAVLPNGDAIATHLNGALVTETLPAQPGEFLVLYASGLGATNNPVATGAASPSNPLASALSVPALTVNSEAASVLFAGLTPTLVGLYQIDFQVPVDAPNGDLTLGLSQNGILANTTILPVHN